MRWADCVLYEYYNQNKVLEGNCMKRSPEDIFVELSERCAELGWVIAMTESEEGKISGIITGKIEFVTSVLNDMDNPDAFDIFDHGPEAEEEIH